MEEKMKYVLSPYDSNTLDDDIIFYTEKYVLDLEQQLQAYKDREDKLKEYAIGISNDWFSDIERNELAKVIGIYC